ncbi:FHA domain-containing protein [Clostridium aestuarii]|nr:FHA domain-containing protein [Clostridium aestuarii]
MPLLRMIFKVLIIGTIYIIIFWALKIMYKDIKKVNRKKNNTRIWGLEVIRVGDVNSQLRVGSVIPIHDKLTIGRKKDNILVLKNEYISQHHAVIFIKNNKCFIKDLRSINGIMINNTKISKESYLMSEDEISIGKYTFKLIG